MDTLFAHRAATKSRFQMSAERRLFGGWNPVEDIWSSRSRVYVRTGSTFGDPAVVANPTPYLSQFPLQPSVRRLIDANSEQMRAVGAPWIGLSIRTQHAHRETVAHSPVQWFADRLREIRAQFPQVSYFLSADAEGVAHELTRLTGLQFLQTAKKWDYNGVSGVQEAMADLHTLATCNYLLLSHLSSFSDMAAQLSAHPGAWETSRASGQVQLTAALA